MEEITSKEATSKDGGLEERGGGMEAASHMHVPPPLLPLFLPLPPLLHTFSAQAHAPRAAHPRPDLQQQLPSPALMPAVGLASPSLSN
jgi:hypothetical protein